MSHLAKERRAQLAQPAKYSEVARSEAHSEGEARARGRANATNAMGDPIHSNGAAIVIPAIPPLSRADF